MSDYSSSNSIVIDNGSAKIRAGFSGDDFPAVEFPTVLGEVRQYLESKERCTKDTFVGAAAQIRRPILSLRHPIEKGQITNWDDVERLWELTFSSLGVSPEDHRVLMAQRPEFPKVQQEKLARTVFEVFQCPALQLVTSSAMPLYAAGKTTGFVIDSGKELTHLLAIHQGNVAQSTDAFEFGGNDVTDYFMRLLASQGHFLKQADKDVAREIKEKICYVTSNVDDLKDEESALLKEFKLPDGQTIKIGSERFKAPEILFSPTLVGIKQPGIHRVAVDAIESCETEFVKQLFSNVVISGGNMMFEGMAERLRREMQSVTSNKVDVLAPKARDWSAWLGASIVCSLSSSQKSWITKEQYEETGPSVIHSETNQNCGF